MNPAIIEQMITLEMHKAKLKEAQVQHAKTMNAKKKAPIFSKKQTGGWQTNQSSQQEPNSRLTTPNEGVRNLASRGFTGAQLRTSASERVGVA